MAAAPVLRVQNLGVSYYTDAGRATALDGCGPGAARRRTAGPCRGVRLGEEHDGACHDAHDQAAGAHRERAGVRGRHGPDGSLGPGHAARASEQDRLHPAGRHELAQPRHADRRADGGRRKGTRAGVCGKRRSKSAACRRWSRWTSSVPSSGCTLTSSAAA